MASKKGGPPKAANKKPRKTVVPGQLYGYSLQFSRVIAHLLRSKSGQSVSLEHLDDVATSSPLGVIAEQDKSGLAHNPVADRAIGLWKTLHIWVRAIREGALRSDTRFVLYVAQDHRGDVVDRIHAVATRTEATELVAELRTEIWGRLPKRAERAALPAELAKEVNGVLDASDEVLALLFTNTTLENGSGAPNEDLLAMLAEKAISERSREKVLNALLGWSKRVIDRCIEKGQPAVISHEDFQKQLIAAAQKHDRSEYLLTSTAAEVTSAQVDEELRARTYVRQLQAVRCGDDELVRAVSDYLRAAADRTTWSERADVLHDSFVEFEDGLERAWTSYRALVAIEQKTAPEEDRGRVLHAKCMLSAVRLQGMEVPAYFVPGGFHTLADCFRVGWHPRYREVLQSNAANLGTKRAVTVDAPKAPAQDAKAGRHGAMGADVDASEKGDT